jgi:small subunit ribosomal protein S4
MARYTGAVCRQCRREGEKLFLKGERCYSDKCAMNRRSFAPGQHGQARKKSSEYGIQLRAKQKAKRYYGVLESQFAKYFEEAERQNGITGENLLKILESRLDNVVYRLGLCSTRCEGRQLVNHAHFTVNGKKCNIPSYIVKVGDVIAVSDGSKGTNRFKALVESDARTLVPKWLEKTDKLSGKVIALPDREDIDYPVEEHLIVELYSK